MKTKECPSCAMEIDEESTSCPICGYEFPRQSGMVKWIAIVLVIALLLLWMM